MSLYVQLIPQKLAWSGAAKLVNSQLSFLCCLFLNAALIKPWCLCVLPTPARLYMTYQRMVEQTGPLTAQSAFTGSGCHHVSPSSCLETTKLQKFPLLYQVFRQFSSQKIGNVNQFKPTDLFGPKDELWSRTQEPFCELFCYMWNHTGLILCECRQVSLLVGCMCTSILEL